MIHSILLIFIKRKEKKTTMNTMSNILEEKKTQIISLYHTYYFKEKGIMQIFRLKFSFIQNVDEEIYINVCDI
jgi:hypothetical protein